MLTGHPEHLGVSSQQKASVCLAPPLLSVNEKDYQVPFRFNSKIDKLTVKLGPDQPMPADRATKQKAKSNLTTILRQR